MDNPFKFLRDAEWTTLKANAQPQRFAEGATILAAGARPGGIMVIDEGTVQVRRGTAGFEMTIAEMTAGDVFGEMSFIESAPAEVTLVAADAVRLLFINHTHVQSIIRDNPAFYGRFFHSLAYILSQRLRETTGRVGKNPEEWLG